MSKAITAQEMGRRGGLARARNLSKKRQSEIGKKAAKAAAKVKSKRTCEYCGVAFLGWRRSKFCSPEHCRASKGLPPKVCKRRKRRPSLSEIFGSFFLKKPKKNRGGRPKKKREKRVCVICNDEIVEKRFARYCDLHRWKRSIKSEKRIDRAAAMRSTGKTYAEIGKVLGVSGQRAHQIVAARGTCEHCGIAFLGWRRSRFCCPEHRRAASWRRK